MVGRKLGKPMVEPPAPTAVEETALQVDDFELELTDSVPEGLLTFTVGYSVKLAINYNTYEATFAVTADASKSDLEEMTTFARKRCLAHLSKILGDLQVDPKNSKK